MHSTPLHSTPLHSTPLHSTLLHFVIWIFSIALVNAQTPFVMTPLDPQNANFTSQEQDDWNALSTSHPNAAIQLVQLSQGTFSASEEDALLTIPGTAQPIATSGAFLSKSSTGSTWFGQLQGQSGRVAIASNGGQTAILLNQASTTKVVQPMGNRYHAVLTFSSSSFDSDEGTSEGAGGDTGCKLKEPCQKTILVTILLTPEARAVLAPPGADPFAVELWFSIGIHSFNAALLSSGVTGKYVRFNVVPFSFPYTTANIDPEFKLLTDLSSLTQTDPADPTSISFADSVRNQFNSDIVVLLTNDRYGSFAGIGDPTFGAAIISANNLWSPRYTFAHELGHVFGAEHNRESNGGDEADSNSRCNYGFNGPLGRSLMCTLFGEGSRLLLFSNPDLGTGDTGSNNAGYLNGTMCDKPFYRNRQEAAVEIAGPLTVCNNQTSVTYTANITLPGSGIPGVGPYTFKWKVSYSPSVTLGSTGILNGTGQTFTFNPASLNPPNVYNTFYVHVTVYTADGIILSDIIGVQKLSCLGRLTNSSHFTASNSFTLAPNPIQNRLEVKFKEEITTTLPFVIHNTLGQIMVQGWVPSGSQNFGLSLDLPDGLYQFSLPTDMGLGTHKFISKH